MKRDWTHRLEGRGAAIAALAAAVLFPLLLRGHGYEAKMLDWGTYVFLYATLALGLNITVGMAGLLVLGYAAFFAIGAYAYGLWLLYAPAWGLAQGQLWAGLALGGVAAAAAGFLVGLPSLRLHGDYLAIVTLGFGETIRYVLKNCYDLTRGDEGIGASAELLRAQAAPLPVGGWLSHDHFLYYLSLSLAAVAAVSVLRLDCSRIGRAWRALRQDELAAKAMGIPAVRYKILAFTLSAAWAGVAGAFYFQFQGYVNPEVFTFDESVLVLSMVVLGGMGSVPGCILGAFVLYSLPRWIRDQSGALKTFDIQNYRLLIFGAALVLMMRFRPEGLLGKRSVVQKGTA